MRTQRIGRSRRRRFVVLCTGASMILGLSAGEASGQCGTQANPTPMVVVSSYQIQVANSLQIAFQIFAMSAYCMSSGNTVMHTVTVPTGTAPGPCVARNPMYTPRPPAVPAGAYQMRNGVGLGPTPSCSFRVFNNIFCNNVLPGACVFNPANGLPVELLDFFVEDGDPTDVEDEDPETTGEEPAN